MREWEVTLTHLTDEDKISLILTCKHFVEYFRYILTGIKDIQRLESEYCKYNRQHSYYIFIGDEIRSVVDKSIEVKGALYDMLCTGSHLALANHTKKEFTFEVEEDIKKYLMLKPESLFFCIGGLRCRDEMSPFMIACHNEKIPIHVIRLLLNSGANPNTFISLNGTYKHLLNDLKQYPDRYKELSALFTEYGVDLATEPPKTPVECMERLMI